MGEPEQERMNPTAFHPKDHQAQVERYLGRFLGEGVRLIRAQELAQSTRDAPWRLDVEVGGRTRLFVLRLESRRLVEVDEGVLLDGEAWEGVVDRDDLVLPSLARGQEAVTLLVLHDLRDNPLQPRKGVVLSVYGE